MMNNRVYKGLCAILLVCLSLAVMGSRAVPRPAAQSPDEVIAAVNALRAQNGLGALSPDPILMQVAQAHAEYMAATGQVTHYSADGSRPYQRALAAGFPIAGDLSLGGFFAENITAGSGMTPQQAVESWQGDAPHLNTMLSSSLSHAGAGVAFSGGMVYYVLDTALYSSYPVSITQPSGSTPLPGQTPASTGDALAWVPAAPLAVSTPAADGSIRHIVQSGETLWTIAAVYGLSVDALVAINALQPDQFIHEGDELLIQEGAAPTASPSASITAFPTRPTATQGAPEPTRTIPTEAASTGTTSASGLAPTATSIFPAETRRDPLGTLVPVGMAICFLLAAVILWQGLRRGTGK